MYDYKYIEFFNKNLVNVSLKADKSIEKAKKYDLKLKIALLN